MVRAYLVNSFSTILVLGVLAACGSSSRPSGIQPVAGSQATAVDATQPPVAVDPVFPEEDFRKTRPNPAKPRPFQLPSVAQFRLDNQLDVYLVERHDLPTISAYVSLDGGSRTDPRNKEGTSSVCVSMMTEGTKKLEKLDFEAALADMASNIWSRGDSDTISVGMSTLTKHFDRTFELFADSILEPGLRTEDLDRLIERRLENLKQVKGSPGALARRLIDSVVYGAKHPLGKISTERSLAKIQITDCKKYLRAYAKPAGGRLYIVGDITKDEVVQKFAPLVASWKGRAKKVGRLPKPSPKKQHIFFVDLPGATQSSIYVTHSGPPRKSPDYFANEIMSQILGGGFSSRINMNLREDKGYSYGARGRFDYSKEYGAFVAASSVRSDATHQSLLEIFREMEELKSGKTPVSPLELEREKNGAIMGMPAQFRTGQNVLSMYGALVYYGLPMNYYDTYVQNMSGVSSEQVMEAAKTLLAPESADILVIGDATAKQITRDGDKDVPLLAAEGADGGTKQQTLLASLQDLAASPRAGKRRLVHLDANGRQVRAK